MKYEMLVTTLWCAVFTWSVQSTILDPSLYLSPRPPLTDSSVNISPSALWSRSADSNHMKKVNNFAPAISDDRLQKSKHKTEQTPRARLFWPSMRPSHYSVGAGNIQIPLTFSLSGIYGKYAPGTVGTGIIGSSYGTVSKVGDTAVSALAGVGYGNYRTLPSLRIYSGENGPAWSGWGNGKWGHYGKG